MNILFFSFTDMVLVCNRLRLHIILITSVSIFIIVIISQDFFIDRFHVLIIQFYPSICPYSVKINGNHIIFDNASFSIHHYPEFICPQNFRNLADWVYGWPEYLFDERLESSLNKTNLNVTKLPDGSIIYVKAISMFSFFSEIYPILPNKFVLVTGQGDEQAPGPFLYYLENPNSKIIHWFGQNGNINTGRSDRFTHIPIGKDIRHN